jgi:hypothetical protein
MTCHIDKNDDMAWNLRRKRRIEFHGDETCCVQLPSAMKLE